MAVIDEALVQILTGDGAVAALVMDRVYPIVTPQGAELPAVVYQRISGPRDETMDGPSGLASPRYQFSCIGRGYGEMVAVAEAVRRALDGFRGDVGGVHVDSILMLNEFREFVAATDEQADRWIAHLDFRVWHLE